MTNDNWRKKMKKLTVILFAMCAVFSVISCGPQTQTVKEDNTIQSPVVKNEIQSEKPLIAQTDETPAETEPVPVVKKEIVPLTDSQKNDINKYSSFAQTKKQQKKFRDMVSYIDQIIGIDPDFTHAKSVLLFWRGQGYEELGLKDSAKTDYERFSELRPDHEQVLTQLDYIYITEGEIDKAITIVEKMIEIDRADTTTEKDFSLLKKAGNYHFQLAENLKTENPDDPDIEEHANSAIEYYDEYLEASPEDEEVNNRHTYLISKFLDQKALKIKLEENYNKNPNDQRTIERLASIYADEGNNSKASQMLEKLLENNPNNLKAVKKLIKINKNNVDKAIYYNQKAIKLEPANEIHNINLAKMYIERKHYADARSECLKAGSKNPRNINVQKTLASVYIANINDCASVIEYQDKLVYVIAYGLYEKTGETGRLHSMKENGQVPSKSDLFINRKTTLPSRECYKWINTSWDEVKYIDTFLKAL